MKEDILQVKCLLLLLLLSLYIRLYERITTNDVYDVQQNLDNTICKCMMLIYFKVNNNTYGLMMDTTHNNIVTINVTYLLSMLSLQTYKYLIVKYVYIYIYIYFIFTTN